MFCTYMFPYRIAKEVGFAEALNGEPADAYLKVDFEKCTKSMTDEEYRARQLSIVNDLAKQLGCDPKYIVPITGKEYLDHTE